MMSEIEGKMMEKAGGGREVDKWERDDEHEGGYIIRHWDCHDTGEVIELRALRGSPERVFVEYFRRWGGVGSEPDEVLELKDLKELNKWLAGKTHGQIKLTQEEFQEICNKILDLEEAEKTGKGWIKSYDYESLKEGEAGWINEITDEGIFLRAVVGEFPRHFEIDFYEDLREEYPTETVDIVTLEELNNYLFQKTKGRFSVTPSEWEEMQKALQALEREWRRAQGYIYWGLRGV